jgi:hypothetical protein
MSEVEDVENLVRSVGTSREGLNKALETVHALRRARERKLLVHFVGWLYVLSVGIIILYLIVRSSIGGQEDAFDNIFADKIRYLCRGAFLGVARFAPTYRCVK